MAARSTNKYFEDMDNNAFDADEPVSAFKAYMARENAQHLVDVSPQYSISWCAAQREAGGQPLDTVKHSDSDTRARYWAQQFPVTTNRYDGGQNYDVRIGMKPVGGVTGYTVYAQIVPWTFGRGVAGDDFWAVSVHTTDASAQWLIDTQIQLGLSLIDAGVRTFPTLDSDGAKRTVLMPMGKLEIMWDATYSTSGSVHLVGVQLRQYA